MGVVHLTWSQYMGVVHLSSESGRWGVVLLSGVQMWGVVHSDLEVSIVCGHLTWS